MKTIILPVPLAVLFGSGCMSIDIGRPEVYTKEFYSGEEAVRVVSTAFLRPEAAVDDRQLSKGRIGVGLKGEVETKTEMAKVYKKMTVERQRKLDFGFCPGWREMLAPSENAMISMCGSSFNPESKGYENLMESGCAWTAGFFLGLYGMIPYACLVEPFYGDWSCSTHHWVLPETPAVAARGIFYAADEMGDRRKALEILSSDEFRHLGLKTCLNAPPESQNAFASQFTHIALFGFHRWSEVRVLPFEETRREKIPGLETKAERRSAVGPFRVTVSVPSRGWDSSVDVPKGRGQAWFDLPDDLPDGVELEIHFSPSGGDAPPVTSGLLETAGETVFRKGL
jgi:hypothetical protein